jgi:serine-type D-Ala-D-Ala carboxypeptidase (penicillin-binding protein 5/6)
MKIIVISRRRLGLYLLLFIGALGISLIYNPSRFANSGSYAVRENFPPLILLPDCQKGPPVHASSSVLIESQSGTVLFAKNPDLRRAPASTTKMMTAIVALEKGNLRSVVKVSPKAAGTPGSSIYLRPGDRISLKELLEGMMLQSGNDGSMAVAEGVAGSVENFVGMMNLKAKEIGALNTNFRNPHGLKAPSHYTTALDLALIARYGLANPRFANLVKRKTATIKWEEQVKPLEIHNTNRLLWYLEGADGVKTGTTNEAGYCLVASATRDERQLIAVVLNSGDRWGDCARLLEYGFKVFTAVKIADQCHSPYRLRVLKGTQPSVNLYPRTDLLAVVRKGEEKLLEPKIIIFNDPVTAPFGSGQIFGKIQYQYHTQLVEGVDLINHQPVPKKRRWWEFE